METMTRPAPSKRSNLSSAVYSLSDLAALLRISYTTAHTSAQSGTLPLTPLRIGRQYFFRKSEVHALLGMTDQQNA